MSKPVQSDHDCLIEISRDVKWLKEGFEKHILHHRQLVYIGLGSIIGAVGLILTLIQVIH